MHEQKRWTLCALTLAGLMMGTRGGVAGPDLPAPEPQDRVLPITSQDDRLTEGSLMHRLHAERSSYAGFSGNGKWDIKARIWLRAPADPQTVALYPLDPIDDAKELDRMLNEAFDVPDGNALTLPGEAVSQTVKASGVELKDAGAYGIKRSAFATEGCVLVTNGVHGGALHLPGGTAAIKLPDFGLQSAFTVEAWYIPDKLGGTLMNLPIGGSGETLVVRLTGEGQVELTTRGVRIGVSERRMSPGTATHVAVVFRKEYKYEVWRPKDCLVFMDGYPQIWDSSHARLISRLGTPLLIGNLPAGDAPFAGRVDDIRVSSCGRDFYQNDNAGCDPSAQHAIAKDLPVMRGKEELILDAPLDGTHATEGLFAATPFPAKAIARYVPARRGKGVVVDLQQGVRFLPTQPVSAAQGTLEFWFMPYDYDNNQVFTDDPAKANLNLFAPVFELMVRSGTETSARPYLSLAINRTSETKGFLIPYYLYPIQPGTWQHIVVTWQGQDLNLFIDGREYPGLSGNHPAYVLRANRAIHPGNLQIAALNLGGFNCLNPQGSTVIDEIKLYKHRLTGVEISNAYQRFLANGRIQPLPPIDLKVSMDHPHRKLSTAVNLLMPERHQAIAYDLEIIKTSDTNAVIATRTDVKLEDGSGFLALTHPGIGYGEYRFRFAFKDAGGKVVKTVDMPYTYPQPAWVDNTLGVHDGEVMPPWTPMEYKDGVLTCWGREMTIGPAGWPVKIVSQGKVIMPSGPEIRFVTDQGEIRLDPAGTLPTLVRQQPGAIATEGLAKGGGWTMTTSIRTEFDGFMKLQTRLEGPANAEVRELRISYPLQFAEDQMFGFYTGEHWFRAAHDFRMLPKPAGSGGAGSPLPAVAGEKTAAKGLAALPREEIVFASNNTGRQHPGGWQGKISFLPYVTIGDDWRSFCWFAENDRNWTQSWTNPAVTISRTNGLTLLNLNIISSPETVRDPLTYTFGLQATPIRPLEPDFRAVQNGFAFGMVCGFNGHYMQAPYEGHFSFRLSPKDLDWAYPVRAAREYRGGDVRRADRPLVMYLDRTWQRAPEDALEYSNDWRGWGDATRYTKPVRDCYAWYVNEWIRRGIMDGMYIDDAWIDPTKSLWHLDPNDNLSYKKDSGKAEDCSDREWGFEFFDYREMLKRIRWLFLDNKVKPLIITHVTQTPYYPVFGFVDIMLEGEDRYLGSENETRDFISTWGIPRLRYASPRKWGVPVQWLPILGDKVKRSGMPMDRWYYQQHRSYLANLLLHDVSTPGGACPQFRNEIRAAGCYADDARFIGYWEPGIPVVAQASNMYASVYQLPKHLAVVLVNATGKEAVADFMIDPVRVKALLGTDVFSFRNMDSAVIPAIDKEYAELRSGGVKMNVIALDGGDDPALSRVTDEILQEMDEADRKQDDPDGFFEYHNFRYENGILRLRIQGNDYRLLKVEPK